MTASVASSPSFCAIFGTPFLNRATVRESDFTPSLYSPQRSWIVANTASSTSAFSESDIYSRFGHRLFSFLDRMGAKVKDAGR